MNRGFTLIELLAVIVVLSLLALLASTSVTKVVRDSKNDLYKTQIISIKSSVEVWGADNPDKLPNVGECKYITLGELKEYGILDSKIINPKNSKSLSDDMLIKISSNKTIHGNNNINYEVDVDDVTGCTLVYPE